MANNISDISVRSNVYASVLFDASNKIGGTEACILSRNEIAEVIDLVASQVGIKDALNNPDIDESKKSSLVETLLTCKSEPVLAVVRELARNGEIDGLKKVLSIYEEMLAEKLNVCVVDVTTVVELDERLRKLIIDKAKADFNLDAVLHETIDKRILGGITMSVNGKCIDASMLSQLNNARAVLKAS